MTATLNGAEVMKLKELLRTVEQGGSPAYVFAELNCLLGFSPKLRNIASELMSAHSVADFVTRHAAVASDAMNVVSNEDLNIRREMELMRNHVAVELGALKGDLSAAIERFNEAATKVQALADQLREEREILVIAQQSAADPNWGII